MKDTILPLFSRELDDYLLALALITKTLLKNQPERVIPALMNS
jgi:hypothetical protein